MYFFKKFHCILHVYDFLLHKKDSAVNTNLSFNKKSEVERQKCDGTPKI